MNATPPKIRVPVLVTDTPRVGIMLDADLVGNQEPVDLDTALHLMEAQWRRDHAELLTLQP